MQCLFGGAILIALLALGLADVSDKKDHAVFKRVVGGTKVSRGSNPWMAAVFAVRGSSESMECPGILIDRQWVLTSVICTFFARKPIDKYKVILGDHDITKKESGEQVFDVTETILHPNFSTTVRLGNDVMLLKLDRKANLNDKVKLLPLIPSSTAKVPVGTKCTLTGWGSTAHDKPSTDRSAILRTITIPIVDHDECQRVNIKNMGFDVDPSSNLCAGYKHARANFSGASGDGGAPLICKENGKDVFRGVGSWGGYADTYTVSTNVTAVVNWIKKAMKSPPPPPLSTSRDNHHYCKQWLKRDDCDYYFKDLIRSYCPISCKSAASKKGQTRANFRDLIW